MNFWSPENLRELTGGRWLQSPDDLACNLSGVGIDSRTIGRGQAFIAVEGPNFDGHDFVAAAAAGGAAIAIVSREMESWPAGFGVLKVDQTVVALQQLAIAYRQVLRDSGVKVIAVTGSNGKTTTRHLIHAVLGARYRGTQSPGNFNNHFGVPLTLLGAAETDDFVVAEVGSNHRGEIEKLAAILRPDVGVITNIGAAHIGHFGTLEAIAAEKGSLLGFIDPGGVALMPDGLEVDLPEYVDRLVPRQAPGLTASLKLPGEHNVRNALLAIEIARWLGMDDQDIRPALASVEPLEGRLQPLHFGHEVTVIHDAYNANPDSVRTAIDQVGRMAARRHVAVLGDMFELGENAPQEHRKLADLLESCWRDDSAACGDHMAVFIGPLASHAVDPLRKRWSTDSVHSFLEFTKRLPQQIVDLLQPGDVVLLKGSRAMALERLIPAVLARFGPISSSPDSSNATDYPQPAIRST